MALTAGPHHLATLTADMDRLIAFYTDVFDATVMDDMSEEWLRHVFLDLGGGFVLHPFEIPGVDVPQGEIPIFQRGRIDHLALRVDTDDEFWEVRERIYKAGASDSNDDGDGLVTDLGPLLSVGFTDPDGLWGEVCWDRPPGEVRASAERANWIYVTWPDRI
jgi:catechol 2,3-dioxygenase-like lactoylglutathione lyase family enzyme